MECDETNKIEFTHEELLEVTTTALNELIRQDTFLSDLPKGVTLEEVNNQIALQYGRSITVHVIRGDSEKMPIVVPQADGTVGDLKKAIKRYVNLKKNREGGSKEGRKKLLSWRYIWKTYNLQHHDALLVDNNAKLADLGIKNKSNVCFVKRKRNKFVINR